MPAAAPWIRTCRTAGWLVCLLAVVGSCERQSGPAEPEVRVLDVWHGWPQQEADGLRRAVAEFERTHPHIRVRLSYAANDLTSNQKLFLAIAGGVGPDVTFVDGQQLAEWAARGALVDLTDAARAAGVRSEDFWTPRWQESVFAGRVYGLPLAADPNFALVWNKRLFREAGLDPDKPPTTVAELDACNDKLFKFDAAGRLVQVGLIPWEWGGDNSFFNWVYAFGGEVYVPPARPGDPGRVTADDPANVAAMRWMQRTATRHGGVRAISQFTANFIGSANNAFYLGRVGMSLMHVEQVRLMKRLAPTVEYGVGFIPQPPGVPAAELLGGRLVAGRAARPGRVARRDHVHEMDVRQRRRFPLRRRELPPDAGLPQQPLVPGPPRPTRI